MWLNLLGAIFHRTETITIVITVTVVQILTVTALFGLCTIIVAVTSIGATIVATFAVEVSVLTSLAVAIVDLYLQTQKVHVGQLLSGFL